MMLRHKLATFLAMSSADRKLACEAILILGVARFIVTAIPFRHIVTLLSLMPDTNVRDAAVLLSVRKAVTTAARNVPWNAVCLPQAIAAKAMLARRGYGSSFHLGADFDAKGKLIGHAWLMAGDMVVVGAVGIPEVTPLARFG